ncbi:MAG: MOSC domain-containing protein [Gammaproteobacteria bacterium]|nr:MOSC domain-containing protein [Gammaproteobacteria bacterium]
MDREVCANLIGIGIRPAAGGNMNELERAQVTVDTGLEGDKRSRPGRRQITLMSEAAWSEACAELGVTLHWTQRRANLLVDALPLEHSTGQTLRIGDVVLEITGETDPCGKMDTAHRGLCRSLQPQWRGGVTCKVIRGGELALGMRVILDNRTMQQQDFGV